MDCHSLSVRTFVHGPIPTALFQLGFIPLTESIADDQGEDA